MQSSTTRIVSHYMTSFLVLNHKRVRYHNGLKNQMITIDIITLPVIASTICKSANTLRMQKLNKLRSQCCAHGNNLYGYGG
jgi:hypothetical protein